MAEYVTEQKLLLFNFLKMHSDTSYTIEELWDKMNGEKIESVPAKSTLYRLMNRLCAEGSVKKFAREGERSFAYQAFLGDSCKTHLHMKCVNCGKLLHLGHEISDELLEKIKSVSDFSVSESDTVLFGNCKDCKAEEKND